MRFQIGFGALPQTLEVPDRNVADVLYPNKIPFERTGADAVKYALRNPIGSGPLKTRISPGESVVIVTSD
ncbi:MAG: lactate racemase domain-containing protein, partial [Synergistaceae bacterium]|nr:lactate racemase domain-containing protein [Synergistaceae bacterium]